MERKADLFDRIGEILTAYKNDDSRSSRLKELAYQEKKSMDCWIFPLQVSESIAQGNEKDAAIFRRWFDL